MASGPSEEDIKQFCEFASLDYDQNYAMVQNALKSNSNLESLITEFYENSDSFRSKYSRVWDESVFGAGKDGITTGAGASFNIESSDIAVLQGVTPPPDYQWQRSAAPSRPPSRVNNKSPIGRIVDWTTNSSSALQDHVDQNDEELQRVLRESAQEATINPASMHHTPVPNGGITPNDSRQGQESGIINGGDPAPVHFGPANRDVYAPESWAMVPTGAAAQETSYVPREPGPAARQRTPGAPAFLVQKPDQWSTRLGAILTIFHEIPLMRNLLLQTGSQPSSYGHNPEWWKGERIYPPHVLAMLQNGASEADAEATIDFQEEVHRLMAFLDNTERSYGSIDALTATLKTGNIPSADRTFFDQWLSSNGEETLKPILHSASQLVVENFEVSEVADTFSFLDIELSENQWTEVKSLNDMWDNLFWNDALSWQEVNSQTKMTTLDDMGEVLTLRIDCDSTQFPGSIDVPNVWYPERYLFARKEAGRQIQEQMAWAAAARYKGLHLQAILGQWEDPKTGKVWQRDRIASEVEAWESALKWFDSKEQYQATATVPDKFKDEIERLNLPPLYAETDVEYHAKAKDYLARLKAVLAHIDGKLANLKAELEQVEAYKNHLRGLLVAPSDDDPSGPFLGKKYLLRGVATAQNVIYVCRRAEPDLIDFDDAAPGPIDQWWRLAYVPGDAEPVKAEKVTVEFVHRQLFQESKSVVAIYATEVALDGVVPVPLADPLQRFVKADNKGFRAEVARAADEKEDVAADAPTAPDQTEFTPLSPSKRKYRSNSVDSMATNRASLGNVSDTNSRAGDFDFERFDGDEAMGDNGVRDGQDDFLASQPTDSMSSQSQVPARDMPFIPTAATAGSLSSFPPLDGQAPDDTSAQGHASTDALLQPAPEMKERGGSSPFLAPRRGSTSTETKQQDVGAQYPLSIDDDMDVTKTTKTT